MQTSARERVTCDRGWRGKAREINQPRYARPTVRPPDVAASDAPTERLPPATDLLKTDLFDVVGRKPVVITFATPALCRSRVCGPVVDIVEQAKAQAPHGVAFIHQEIYQDNNANKPVQGPVAAWRLQSEPWTFVINRRGRIAARFEGAFSAGELEREIAKVAKT